MSRMLVVWRLALGDIKRHRAQSAMLIVMLATTTTTLALALALQQTTRAPFGRTRAATRGPDVVAEIGFDASARRASAQQFAPLLHAPGVRASAGPYPLAFLALTASGVDVPVQAEGRAPDATAREQTIDRPLLVAGSWVRAGAVVLEQGLASTLKLKVGERVRLGGREFAVGGIAMTTAQPFYPARVPGLVWVTNAAATELAAQTGRLGYLLDLRLDDPASAAAFGSSPAAGAFVQQGIAGNEPSLIEASPEVRTEDYKLIGLDRKVLLVGSWLLAMLATASIAVAAGGRMAQQARRVGLLKAIGATPSLVATVLLAQNLLLALAAAVVGLAAGELLAPSLASPGQGLLGGPGSPQPSGAGIAVVLAVAAAAAAIATIGPAVRAGRTSTIGALSDRIGQPPRRRWLISLSAALPVSLLLALRLVARRARRTALAATSLTIAVAMVVAALTVQHDLQVTKRRSPTVGLFTSAISDRANHVLIVLSVTLVVLAAVTATFTAWATVIDAQRTTALARALGATPRQVAGGLTAAQLVPALAAACTGVPAGLALYQLAGGHLTEARPPLSWLLAVIPATLLAVAAITAVPARIGANRSVADVLRAARS
jgi:putative ABC transport system permease protein